MQEDLLARRTKNRPTSQERIEASTKNVQIARVRTEVINEKRETYDEDANDTNLQSLSHPVRLKNGS